MVTTLAAYAAWRGVRVLRCLDGQLVSQLVGDRDARPIMPARDVAMTDSSDVLLVATQREIVVMAAEDNGGVCPKPEYGRTPLPAETRLLAAKVDERGVHLRALVTTPTESQAMELSPVRRSERLDGPAVAGAFVGDAPALVMAEGVVSADLVGGGEPPWLGADAATVAPDVTVLAALCGAGVALSRKDAVGRVERRWLPGNYEGVAIVRERKRTDEIRLVTLDGAGELEVHGWSSIGMQPAPAIVPQQRQDKRFRVFVSYPHSAECDRSTLDEKQCCTGRELADSLVEVLAARHEVRWDALLPPGAHYDHWIPGEVGSAEVVVVLWTPASESRLKSHAASVDGSTAGQLMELVYALEDARIRVIPLLTADVEAGGIEWPGLKRASVLRLRAGEKFSAMSRTLDAAVRNDSWVKKDYAGARRAKAPRAGS